MQRFIATIIFLLVPLVSFGDYVRIPYTGSRWNFEVSPAICGAYGLALNPSGLSSELKWHLQVTMTGIVSGGGTYTQVVEPFPGVFNTYLWRIDTVSLSGTVRCASCSTVYPGNFSAAVVIFDESGRPKFGHFTINNVCTTASCPNNDGYLTNWGSY